MDATNVSNAATAANEKVNELKIAAIHFVEAKGPAILAAVMIVIVGVIAARWVNTILMRSLNKKDLEPPVKMLISRLVKLLVMGLALVVALGTAGVDVVALVAGIGVAGVGVGLAMQGVLSNMVAGLTIIFTKPFRVGEYIELVGVQGQVDSVELFTTTLVHADRSRVVVPNRKIVGEILHNYGNIRQLDLSVGVSYASDVNEVLATVKDILAANPRVLKDPAPGFGVTSLGESSIVIAVKPWTKLADFGPAQAEIYRAILDEFRGRKIEIPFPQRELRMLPATA